MWIDGKPEKTGMALIEWTNSLGDPPCLKLIVRRKDGQLYLFGGKKMPYPLSESAIKRHFWVPLPPGDGMNFDFFTTDFDPETCVCNFEDESQVVCWYDPAALHIEMKQDETAWEYLERFKVWEDWRQRMIVIIPSEYQTDFWNLLKDGTCSSEFEKVLEAHTEYQEILNEYMDLIFPALKV